METTAEGTTLKYYVTEIIWLNGIDHGWGNGYVCLPEGHPCFGMDYDEIHKKYPSLEVHGGLTFSSSSDVMKETPEKPEGKFWIIGFDCAHYGDSQSTCPKDYVERETKNLARQMEEIQNS